MPSNITSLHAGPRWRVMLAHQRADVRHVLRTLVGTENIAIVEVPDGDAALAQLERTRFDLLVLELDLPLRDGLTVMQLHRVLLAHERIRVEPPEVILMLAPEVRGNPALTDHLRELGVAGVIDDAPRPDVATLLRSTLEARAVRLSGRPAAA